MMDMVPVGEELMPHRERPNGIPGSQAGPIPDDSQAAFHTTPIKKLSRNRGLVIQEQLVVEDSPEMDDSIAIRKCKRRLH